MPSLIVIRIIAFTVGTALAACGAPDETARVPASPAAGTTAPTTAEQAAQSRPDAPSSPEPAATAPARPPANAPARSADSVATGRAGGAVPEPKPGAGTGVEAQAQDPSALLKKTAGVYAGIRSMQAGFAMVTTNPLLHSTVRSRGTLFQRRPDRILLRFTEPKGDMILGDGRYFWVYYPSVDAQQVTRTSAVNASGVVDLQAQFVGDPLERFEHTFNGHETVDGRDAAIFTLVPREDPGYRVLKVWIDTKDFLVRRFEVTDNSGIVRRLDLTDLQTDPAMADDLFRFTPPPGTKIVERG